MRALVQRVSSGGVEIVEEKHDERIQKGMVILLGIHEDDTEEDVAFVAAKCANLRIFPDEDDKMNHSLKDIGGEALVISQFTLYGDTLKGNRPNFMAAAKPDKAIPLYESFVKQMKTELSEDRVKTGIFGAMMNVHIVNDGPVTILVTSKPK